MAFLLVLLALFAPRLIVVFAWIARPVYFDAVFDTWNRASSPGTSR